MTKVKPGVRVDWLRTPAYATGDENYTLLNYSDGTSKLSATTIKVILGRFPALLRVHKRIAVDPAYIGGWRRLPGSRLRIWLRDGTLIEVARRRVSEITQVLETKQPERA